jgi:membrane-associated phospholipid phosphatase
MRIPLKPVDVLSLSVIAVLSTVTVVFSRSLPSWGWLIARYGLLVLAIVTIAVSASRSKTGKLVHFVHTFLPVLIIPVIFDSLGDLIPWIRLRFFDDVLIRIDYNLFGGRHPTVMLEWFIHPLLTTILQFAYISYYPMAVVLGVVLFMKKKRKEFNETIFGIILCFYLSYLGYLLVPAVGPRFTLVQLQTRDLQAGPLVVAIQETLNALENTKTDAFPSGHTAVALMTLYYAWKTREKTLTVLLLPTVLGLILSTVYLRYHYVIDVIAGIALTVLTVYLAPPLYAWSSRASDLHNQLHHPS